MPDESRGAVDCEGDRPGAAIGGDVHWAWDVAVFAYTQFAGAGGFPRPEIRDGTPWRIRAIKTPLNNLDQLSVLGAAGSFWSRRVAGHTIERREKAD